jgi:hypothetical protein
VRVSQRSHEDSYAPVGVASPYIRSRVPMAWILLSSWPNNMGQFGGEGIDRVLVAGVLCEKHWLIVFSGGMCRQCYDEKRDN